MDWNLALTVGSVLLAAIIGALVTAWATRASVRESIEAARRDRQMAREEEEESARARSDAALNDALETARAELKLNLSAIAPKNAEHDPVAYPPLSRAAMSALFPYFPDLPRDIRLNVQFVDNTAAQYNAVADVFNLHSTNLDRLDAGPRAQLRWEVDQGMNEARGMMESARVNFEKFYGRSWAETD